MEFEGSPIDAGDFQKAEEDQDLTLVITKFQSSSISKQAEMINHLFLLNDDRTISLKSSRSLYHYSLMRNWERAKFNKQSPKPTQVFECKNTKYKSGSFKRCDLNLMQIWSAKILLQASREELIELISKMESSGYTGLK